MSPCSRPAGVALALFTMLAAAGQTHAQPASQSHAQFKAPTRVLQRIDTGVPIHPVRMAAIRVHDGRVEFQGLWHDVPTFTSRDHEKCIFDCLGWNWETDTPEPCGVFFFGDGYLNPNTAEDIVAHDTSASAWSSIKSAFYWCPAAEDSCLLFFLLNPDAGIGACIPPASEGALGGVVLDFGVLPPGCTGYYYFDADISSLGLPWSPGVASHSLKIATGISSEGEIVLATDNTQFVLSGTPEDYVGVPPPAGSCGEQGPMAFDDDAPTDGVFDAAAECYDYSFAACVDPLGKAVAYGQPSGQCPADFNNDGFLSGDDFDQYVAAFELGEPTADFNGDGFVTGDDFDGFVAAFEAGC